MKKIISVLVLASVVLTTKSINAQTEVDPLSIYETSYLKSSTNIQVGIGLIDYDFQAGLGISGHLYVSNLFEKISAEVSYHHVYLGKNDLQETEILPENLNSFKNKSYNIGIAYTFKQDAYGEDNELRLSGNNETGGSYTIVEHQVIKSLAVRFGLHAKSFGFKYNDANITLEDSYIDVFTNQPVYIEKDYSTAMLHQNINMIYAGFSIKKSYDSYFEVEKFGKKRSNVENETYFDILISTGGELLPIQRFVGHSVGGSINTESISAEDQTEILSEFKKLPIGLRVGRRTTNRKMTNFSIEYYGGISPMYYLKPYQAINFGVKINLRILKPLK